MAVYQWTTPKGAQIELDYNKTTEQYVDTIYADGDNIQVTRTRKVINLRLTVNGETCPAELGNVREHGKWVRAIKLTLDGRPAAVVIPDHICREMFAPTQAERAAMRAEAEHEAFVRRWESGYGDAEYSR